ncbi:MAG: DUF7149 domain-containing protein [Bacteroidota bacterium]
MKPAQLTIRKSINKAFLRVKPNRNQIERFKKNILNLYQQINESESEEHHKNIISKFLSDTYYSPNYYINTKGRTDLVIHNGKDASTSVGVLIETKNPANKSEMPDTNNLNAKALHELLLYYLRERISGNNIEVKHLIVTNIYEWFIFDATVFDKLFAENKTLVKQFNDFEEGRLAGTTTNFFYKNIAKLFLKELDHRIPVTYLDLRDFEKIINNNNKQDDKKLVALFKLFSPENMLKLPFANDSNSLDKGFYSELLHIIGLQESQKGSKKLIGRKAENKRNEGSLIENTIRILTYDDCLTQIKSNDYGNTKEEQIYSVALELVITWINRILFLKLLEGQLIKYHAGDNNYKFLNSERIPDFDALNKLFFQVLAIKESERNDIVKRQFGNIPYLNSSLFEPNELEHKTIRISNLEDEFNLPVLPTTVLKDKTGKRRKEGINTLEYLFEFLDAYDFSSEGGEDIQEENKTLINASVLGLIFEKINGYKEGSFFTPGFITMYMAKESIRRAVVQKFNETKGWNCKSIDDIYNQLEVSDRAEANAIINNIKICDPAVGSGHFLVSALNEIIAVKNDLKILSDRKGKRLKEYQAEVVNDELVVTDEDGEPFEYKPNNRESQRVQETLFHEKQTIIENCLFGVDINPNSVKICRLRLWIELLKNAYYKSSSPHKGEVSEGRRGYEKLNNLPYLKTFRKNLRKNMTPAEATLWKTLQGKKFEGRKFRRQHSIGNYIVDFYCPSEKLAIELDGEVHNTPEAKEYDRERDLFLKYFGVTVLRFENRMVFENQETVLEIIKGEFGKKPPRPSDTSPLEGGEPQGEGTTDNYPDQGGEPQREGTSDKQYLNKGETQERITANTNYLNSGKTRELETLPNIDINIKCGNSLISRYPLDSDIKKALKNSKWNIDTYRNYIANYRKAKNKEQKREMQRVIDQIKDEFESEIAANDKRVIRLNKLKGEMFAMHNQTQLFDKSKKEKTEWNKKLDKLATSIQKLEKEIEAIRTNKIYKNAFEWRFEFPEVLNDDGDFVGFDVVIGNPPWGVKLSQDKLIKIKSENSEIIVRMIDTFMFFINLSFKITSNNAIISQIVPDVLLYQIDNKKLRKKIIEKYHLCVAVNLGDNIFEDVARPSCIIVIAKDKYFNSITNVFEYRKKNKLSINQITNTIIKSNIFKTLPNYVFATKNLNGYKIISRFNEANLNELIDEDGIQRGVSPDLKQAFIVDNQTIKNENLELAHVFPTVTGGRDIKKYLVHDIDKNVIYTRKTHDESKIPNIINYLERFKNSINCREVKQGKHPFWSLHRARNQKIFTKPSKILGVITSDRISVSIDYNKLYPTDGIFILSSNGIYSNEFLIGFLNSKLITYFYRLISMEEKRTLAQIKPAILEIIPVSKLFNRELVLEIDDKSNKIINLKRNNTDTTALEQEIDRLVYELYGLTDDEIDIVEASVK